MITNDTIKKVISDVNKINPPYKKYRNALWVELLKYIECETFCEVGVFEGNFSKLIMQNKPSIEKYYMLDPWKNLSNWNKPANRSDEVFSQIYQTAINNTNDFSNKRIILRDECKNICNEIPDESLDVVYIDGDHTLRGITIDLHMMLPKVKPGGIISGDDLAKNIFRHGPSYSPTQVFPYVLYFAECHNFEIHLLPVMQFIMIKKETQYKVYDYDNYNNLSLSDIYKGGPQ